MTDDVGLCLTCRWMRAVTNRRGSTFFRCGRADTDPRFSRYPALPMLQCVGYDQGRPDDAAGGGERGAPPQARIGAGLFRRRGGFPPFGFRPPRTPFPPWLF